MKSCVVVVLVGLVGCSWSGVEGSGKSRSEVRPLTGFTAVEVSGVIHAEIALAAEPRVEIEGDDNLVALVTTELAGDVLKIYTRKSVRPTVRLIARIAAPQITAVEAAGSSGVALRGMSGDRLQLSLAGSSSIRGDGAVQQLGVELSGSGKVDVDQLAAERASVAISGSGDVSLAVSQALDVTISGSGDVIYRGDPTVAQAISGSGRVVKR